jgi:quercetin dioxygenase-like cupin family protein
MSQENISVSREHLSSVDLTSKVDRIESYRVVLGPGQRTGVHHHPGGVVGVIVSGSVIFECNGEVRTLNAGDAFVEVPGAPVVRFDNASDDQPAVFIAHYPLEGNQPLLVTGEALN